MKKEKTHILIVDDEEPIRRLLNRLLKMNDYVCALAADAAQARKALKNQNFDLVLCDMKMPGESGMDLTRYVTAEYPDTAVIMVTAVDDPEVAKTALEIGAYGYIIKPFRPNEVTINVTNALRRRTLEIDNRTYRDKLEHIVAKRTAELQATLGKLQKSMEGVIQAMAMTIESR